MDSTSVDLETWARFQAFLAFEKAGKPKRAEEEQRCKSTNVQPPTIGKSSDTVELQGDASIHGDNSRDRSPTIGRSSDFVETLEDQSQGLRAASPVAETKKATDGSSENRVQVNTMPPSLEDPQSRLPTPEYTKTPRAFTQHNAKRPQSLNASRDPLPERRSCLPTPSSSKRDRTLSPKAGPSKRRRCRSPSPSHPEATRRPPHPYDKCATSYETRPGKRGGRITRILDGKKDVVCTPMEQLIHCHKKYRRMLEHGHLFGNKHACYFNPYSRSAINKKKCTRIDKPPGFQIGRGGPGSVPIHEAIGLRDDYDYRLDIGRALRKALILFKPQNLNLKPKQQLTYKHYGSSRRAKINNYMYERFLFLYHFRDESGEDSWALIAIASSILTSNSAYIKTTDSTKANVYLKRNASGPQGEGKGEGKDKGNDNEDDEEDNDNQYKDDYLVNTYGNRKTQATSSSTRSSTTTNKRACPSEPDSKSRRNDKNPHPSKKQRSESKERSSSPVLLPPQPTNTDIHRANKVVAQERARNKALGASRDRAGTKPSAPPKGKEKEKEERDRSRLDHKSKRGHRKEVEVQDEDEDEGEDEEPVQLVFKKVRRVDSGLSSPEPEPAPKKSTKAPPKPSTKATKKTPAKGTSKGKSAKGKDLSPEPVEDFELEPEPVKQRRCPPPKPPLRPQNQDEPKEPEEDVPRPHGKRPSTAKASRPDEDDDEELEALPARIIYQPDPKATTSESNKDKRRGGNAGENAETRPARAPKTKSSSSKAAKPTNEAAQADLQELVELGKAKAITKIVIKRGVNPSQRELCSGSRRA